MRVPKNNNRLWNEIKRLYLSTKEGFKAFAKKIIYGFDTQLIKGYETYKKFAFSFYFFLGAFTFIAVYVWKKPKKTEDNQSIKTEKPIPEPFNQIESRANNAYPLLTIDAFEFIETDTISNELDSLILASKEVNDFEQYMFFLFLKIGVEIGRNNFDEAAKTAEKALQEIKGMEGFIRKHVVELKFHLFLGYALLYQSKYKEASKHFEKCRTYIYDFDNPIDQYFLAKAIGILDNHSGFHKIAVKPLEASIFFVDSEERPSITKVIDFCESLIDDYGLSQRSFTEIQDFELAEVRCELAIAYESSGKIDFAKTQLQHLINSSDVLVEALGYSRMTNLLFCDDDSEYICYLDSLNYQIDKIKSKKSFVNHDTLLFLEINSALANPNYNLSELDFYLKQEDKVSKELLVEGLRLYQDEKSKEKVDSLEKKLKKNPIFFWLKKQIPPYEIREKKERQWLASLLSLIDSRKYFYIGWIRTLAFAIFIFLVFIFLIVAYFLWKVFIWLVRWRVDKVKRKRRDLEIIDEKDKERDEIVAKKEEENTELLKELKDKEKQRIEAEEKRRKKEIQLKNRENELLLLLENKDEEITRLALKENTEELVKNQKKKQLELNVSYSLNDGLYEKRSFDFGDLVAIATTGKKNISKVYFNRLYSSGRQEVYVHQSLSELLQTINETHEIDFIVRVMNRLIVSLLHIDLVSKYKFKIKHKKFENEEYEVSRTPKYRKKFQEKCDKYGGLKGESR